MSESAVAYGTKSQGEYTLEDYYALPDDQKVELIDGVFYDMASLLFVHQRVAGELHRQIANYICMKYNKNPPVHKSPEGFRFAH
ncbi:MAG: Uma2 family endonuclease [Clostridiales bacterium]|nr:Uma2 family endonuclease [Clostridiales bacterium]